MRAKFAQECALAPDVTNIAPTLATGFLNRGIQTPY
jgi:hypothetical protein